LRAFVSHPSLGRGRDGIAQPHCDWVR
jgi:hypothetical protein